LELKEWGIAVQHPCDVRLVLQPIPINDIGCLRMIVELEQGSRTGVPQVEDILAFTDELADIKIKELFGIAMIPYGP
jgi:hypothetical protein